MEKNRKSRSKKNPKVLLAISAAGAVAVVAGAAWGVTTLERQHTIRTAREYLSKGFAALAVDEAVEPHRYSLTHSSEGCAVALDSYFQAHRAERLEWAAQSCIHAGVEIPESYMGLAASRELTGRDPEALQILNQALAKFEKSADIYYRIGLILRRNKKDNEAVQAYLKAVGYAPNNNQLSLDALEYFLSQGRWTDAKQMAERLRGVETDNPEVKLVLARAFMRAGDKGSAEGVIQQARALMEKKPDLKAALERSYGDVLGSGKLAEAPVPPDANRSVASDGKPVAPPMPQQMQGPPAGQADGRHAPRTF